MMKEIDWSRNAKIIRICFSIIRAQ